MKKFLSILISLTVISSLIPLAFAEESGYDKDAYIKNVGMAEAFGGEIPDDAEGDDGINRAAFVKLAMDMYGRDFTGYSAGNYYRDVQEGKTNGAKEINAATAMGILSGTGSGYFRPDAIITYTEAYKIALEILGYNAFAMVEGGFAAGYESLADSVGLTKGIVRSTGSMNYSDALKLISNMLNSKITKKDIIDGDVELTDKTFLENYRNVGRVKGTVTANEMTGLYDSTDAGSDRVVIGGYTYGVGETNAAAYLGYEVYAYVERESQDLVYICDTGRDTADEFSGMSIDRFENGALIYDDGAKEKRITFSDRAPVIYNKKFVGNVGNIDVNSYIDDAYNITVINSVTGEKFLFVTEYTTLAVTSVSTADGVIYGKYGKSFTIPDGAEVEVRNLGEDKKSELSSIASGNVIEALSVTSPSGKDIVYITIVDYPFKGYLKGTGSKGAYKVWIIDGTEYIVAKSLTSAAGVTLPGMGDKAVYYVDSMSRIVAVDFTESSNYAYLLKTYRDEDDDEVYVKLYNSDGEFVTLQCKEKLLCDTTSTVSSAQVLNISNKQLVQIETNKKGQLTEIYTAANVINTDKTPGYDFDTFSLDYKIEGTSAYFWRVYLRQETAYSKSSFSAGNKTVVFDIPQNTGDTKKFKMRKYSEFGTGGSLPQGTKVYDIDELGVASAIVIERASATIDSASGEGSSMNVIDSVTEVYDDENGACYSFKFYDRSEAVLGIQSEITYDTASEDYGYDSTVSTIAGLKEGDVITYVTDNDGMIVSYKLVFRPTDPLKMTYRGGLVGAWWLGYGTVQKVDNGVFSTVDSLNSALRSFTFDSQLANSVRKEGNNVIIYNSKKKNVTIGTLDDIREGDKVFTRVQYGIFSFVMIVR